MLQKDIFSIEVSYSCFKVDVKKIIVGTDFILLSHECFEKLTINIY